MIQTMEEFVSALKAARRVSTPLVMIRTADPADSIETLSRVLNGQSEKTPVLVWDIMHGLAGVNRLGKAEAARVLDGGDPAMTSARPSDALTMAEKLADDSILFFLNGHRFYADAVVMQGIWNLRDRFKASGRMLMLVTAPGATLPNELAQDVLVIDEPLPSVDDLKGIARSVFNDAKMGEPDTSVVEKAVDALIGLAGFPAEQSLAMSLVPKGLDTEALWERKRQIIEQTPGLSV
jgi:hypothetical protein